MNKKILLAVIFGFLIGTAWLVAIRFFTYKSDTVHYHANFALYINGQQDEFDNFTFYEEVQGCEADAMNNPKARTHLHGEVASVIHVEDTAVTWGHFFANLGYGLTDNSIRNDEGVFVAGDSGSSLSFWLNGKEVSSVANRVIDSEDVLLVNYGPADEDTIHERFDAIPTDAGEYNGKSDPSSCAGTKPTTLLERLRSATNMSF